ncbi:hypothetical protein RA876_14180 [Rhodoferax antarcticus]|nr:hypothetical protein RA876_14180 [Rhodoferax antarcticus]
MKSITCVQEVSNLGSLINSTKSRTQFWENCSSCRVPSNFTYLLVPLADGDGLTVCPPNAALADVAQKGQQPYD